MKVCETERLVIRHFKSSDAEYVLRQLNESAFIEYIGDRNVRTDEDAIQYLKNGPIASYERFGFGLNMVLLKGSYTPMGMCGLIKRKELEYPDLGFAFLPEFWGKGYALEASRAVIETVSQYHGVERVMGITLPGNVASNSLLIKLNFIRNGSVELDGQQNSLYEYRVGGKNDVIT